MVGFESPNRMKAESGVMVVSNHTEELLFRKEIHYR